MFKPVPIIEAETGKPGSAAEEEKQPSGRLDDPFLEQPSDELTPEDFDSSD